MAGTKCSSRERLGANELRAILAHSIGKRGELGFSESDGEPLKVSNIRMTVICVKF